MGIDIRLPIGAMFTILGLLLVVLGLAGDQAIYQKSLGININLIWGAVLVLFGREVFKRLEKARSFTESLATNAIAGMQQVVRESSQAQQQIMGASIQAQREVTEALTRLCAEIAEMRAQGTRERERILSELRLMAGSQVRAEARE